LALAFPALATATNQRRGGGEVVIPDQQSFTGNGTWVDVGETRPRLNDPSVEYSAALPEDWNRKIEYSLNYEETPMTWPAPMDWDGVSSLLAGVFAGTIDEAEITHAKFNIRYRVVLYRSGEDSVVGDWQNLANDGLYDMISVNPNLITVAHFGAVSWYYTGDGSNPDNVIFDGDSWVLSQEYGTYGKVQWRACFNGDNYSDYLDVVATDALGQLNGSVVLPVVVALGLDVTLRVRPYRNVLTPGGGSALYAAEEFTVGSDTATLPSAPALLDDGTFFGNPFILYESTNVNLRWLFTPSSRYYPIVQFYLQYGEPEAGLTTINITPRTVSGDGSDFTGDFIVTPDMALTIFHVGFAMQGVELTPLASWVSGAGV
jgi:hypothetical protein